MKIKLEHGKNSKISSRGWQAWKNWFFNQVTFLAPAHAILKKWPKIDQSQKSQNTKKSLTSWLSTTQRNFWDSLILWTFFHDSFFKTLNFYFKMVGPFCKQFFGSNHYLWLVLWLVWCGAESKNSGWPLPCMCY